LPLGTLTLTLNGLADLESLLLVVGSRLGSTFTRNCKVMATFSRWQRSIPHGVCATSPLQISTLSKSLEASTDLNDKAWGLLDGSRMSSCCHNVQLSHQCTSTSPRSHHRSFPGLQLNPHSATCISLQQEGASHDLSVPSVPDIELPCLHLGTPHFISPLSAYRRSWPCCFLGACLWPRCRGCGWGRLSRGGRLGKRPQARNVNSCVPHKALRQH
jgi:hypothetical protein